MASISRVGKGIYLAVSSRSATTQLINRKRSSCSYRTGMQMCGRLPWHHQGCWKETRVPEGVSRNEALLFSFHGGKEYLSMLAVGPFVVRDSVSVTTTQKSHRYPYIYPSPAST